MPGIPERAGPLLPDPPRGAPLVQALACGFCRTDVQVIDHEMPEVFERVVPGHQIVGRILRLRREVTSLRGGDLAGVTWLHSGGIRGIRGFGSERDLRSVTAKTDHNGRVSGPIIISLMDRQ